MVRIQAPVRGDAHALQQTLHQLDIGPGQLPILTALNPGRLLDQAYAQHGMIPEPGTLLGIESRAQRHARVFSPGVGDHQQQQQG